MLSHVDDKPTGKPSIRALRGWVSDVGQLDEGFSRAAGVCAEPLVALTLWVKAVSGKGIPEGADGAALVIIAAQGPFGFVPVGGVRAKINDPSCMKMMVHGV